MMTYDGKVFRNLQEQVAYLTEIWNTNALANEMGIRVIGTVATAADIPADDPDHPYQYGDAYMVGSEPPYRMYIFTRADGGHPTDYFFDIGYFPLPGPQGETGIGVDDLSGAVFTANSGEGVVFQSGDVFTINGTMTFSYDGETASAPASIQIKLLNGDLNLDIEAEGDGKTILINASNKLMTESFVPIATNVTSRTQSYVKNPDGSQGLVPISTGGSALGNHITLYNPQGCIPVNDPTSDSHATPRGYADGRYLQKRYVHTLDITLTITSLGSFNVQISIISAQSSAYTALSGKDIRNYIDGKPFSCYCESNDRNHNLCSFILGISDNYSGGALGIGFQYIDWAGSIHNVDGIDTTYNTNLSSVSVVDTVTVF